MKTPAPPSFRRDRSASSNVPARCAGSSCG